jgi:hypothetical protein
MPFKRDNETPRATGFVRDAEAVKPFAPTPTKAPAQEAVRYRESCEQRHPTFELPPGMTMQEFIERDARIKRAEREEERAASLPTFEDDPTAHSGYEPQGHLHDRWMAGGAPHGVDGWLRNL